MTDQVTSTAEGGSDHGDHGDVASAGTRLVDLTSSETEALVRRNGIAVVALGSVEQHGPHLPNGTDIVAADLVADAVAEHMHALRVPFAPYGVTPLHAGWPGTISLRQETFDALLTDVCRELIGHGVHTVVLVNWHEGNIPSMNAVATRLQAEHDTTFIAVQGCYVAQRIYRELGGELTHGGGIETLAVLAHDPALVKVDRAGEPSRPPGAAELDLMRRSREVYGFVTDVAELTEAGWYGNPAWADAELAKGFADTVAAEVMRQVRAVVHARQGRQRERGSDG